MSRGRHIVLQKLNIMFFRIAPKSVFLWSKCSTLVKIGKLAVKNVNRKKKFSHESESLKISYQDLFVSYLVAWYYVKSRET